MLHRINYSFNIIDLLTTLIIIAIISLAVINLFQSPLPLPQAITQVSPEDMGDQFLNLMAGRIESDWAELDAIPGEPDTESDEESLVFSNQELFRNSNPLVHFAAPSEEFSWDPRYCNRGIFKLTHTDTKGQVDFRGYIRAWKEMPTRSTTDSTPFLVNLNIELSWPGEIPYDQRSRIYRKVRLVRPARAISETDTLLDLPCGSVWGIEMVDAPTLFYYTVGQPDHTLVWREGEILNLSAGTVEGLTCTTTGIYFIYRMPFDLMAELYLLPRGQIDGDAGTPLTPTRIGPTHLIGHNLAGLHYIDGRLWGVGETSGWVYSVNQLTGACTEVASLSVKGLNVGAMTMDATQHVLLATNRATTTTIYSFESFPNGDLVAVTELETDQPVECMAAHPDGSLYLYNGITCWELKSETYQCRRQSKFVAAISDMAFFYKHEQDYCLAPYIIEHEY